MNKFSKEDLGKLVDREGKKELLLSVQQCVTLLNAGKKVDTIERLNTSLYKEITEMSKGATGKIFIPSLWIEHRAEGKKPSEIEYDWVHMFR